MSFSEFASKVLFASIRGNLKEMYNGQEWFIISDILRDDRRTRGEVKRLEEVSGIENFYFKDAAALLQVNKILKQNKIGYW